MKPNRIAATLALAALSAVGCTAPIDTGEPMTGSSDEALTTYKSVTIGAPTFASEMSAIGLSQTSLVIANGVGTFTPPPMVTSLGLMRPFTFAVPNVPVSTTGPFPQGVVEGVSLSLASLTFGPEGSYLVAHATLTGSYTFGSSVANAGVYVDAANVTLRFANDPSSGRLLLVDTSASVSQHVTSCGLANWCAASLEPTLAPAINGVVHAQAVSFGTQLATSLGTAWHYDLRANANSPTHAASTWLWTAVTSSVAIASSTVSFTATTNVVSIPPAAE